MKKNRCPLCRVGLRRGGPGDPHFSSAAHRRREGRFRRGFAREFARRFDELLKQWLKHGGQKPESPARNRKARRRKRL